jgi:hypothetical protein
MPLKKELKISATGKLIAKKNHQTLWKRHLCLCQSQSLNLKAQVKKEKLSHVFLMHYLYKCEYGTFKADEITIRRQRG